MKTIHVDDGLFQELCEAWKRNPGVFNIQWWLLVEKLNIGFDAGSKENLLLFGRRDESIISEEIVGRLYAVVPGVVILNSGVFNARLNGLVRRQVAPHKALFDVRMFHDARSSLVIYPSSFPEVPRYNKCPAWVSWSVDTNGGNIGIDPERWTTALEPWLAKWLPPSGS